MRYHYLPKSDKLLLKRVDMFLCLLTEDKITLAVMIVEKKKF
jgi:hypothetical protein